MRIAVGSDEKTHLTDFVVEELKKRGHQVELFGPLAGDDALARGTAEGEAAETGERASASEEEDWPVVSRAVAERVASGAADEGIVFCWTGTGASIAANKVPGVRAALCHDAETARGARIWNHANVLVLSLRATPEPIAREILDAWFSTPYSDDEWNLRQIERVRQIENKQMTKSQ